MMATDSVIPNYIDIPLTKIANTLSDIKKYLQERLNLINYHNFTIYMLYKQQDYNILIGNYFNFIKPYIKEFPIEIKEDILFLLENINITEELLENVAYVTVNNISIREIMKYNNYLEVVLPEKIKLIFDKNIFEVRLEIEIQKNNDIIINKIDFKKLKSCLNSLNQMYKIKINITYDKTLFIVRYILNKKMSNNDKLSDVIKNLKQIRESLINLYF